MSLRATSLPSGLRIVTDSSPHLRTASLGVFVGAGSRNEALEEHGLSHLLEHMAFKGTRRRNARQIAEAIEPTMRVTNRADATPPSVARAGFRRHHRQARSARAARSISSISASVAPGLA